MVTTLLKMLFITNETVSHGFSNFATLLPDSLVIQYLDYYAVGSGYVVLAFIHLATLISALYAPQSYLRWLSKAFIVMSILLYSSGSSKVVVNTIVPLNILGLPILKFPIPLFSLFCLGVALVQFWEFRKYLRGNCRKSVIYTVDIVSAMLLLLFMLPILTGELWYV